MNYIARKAIELFAESLGHPEFLQWCTRAVNAGAPSIGREFAVQALSHCERRDFNETVPEDAAKVSEVLSAANQEIPRIAAAIKTAAPKLELRKLKIAEFASEETTCYSAEVWMDGRHVFTASNSGKGGCDDYYPVSSDGGRKRMEHALDVLSAFAWTQLPRTSHGMVLFHDVESLIADLIEKAQVAKIVARTMRAMRDRIVMIREGKVYQTKRRPEGITPSLVQQAVTQFATAKVLNALPQQEAEALLTKVLAQP